VETVRDFFCVCDYNLELQEFTVMKSRYYIRDSEWANLNWQTLCATTIAKNGDKLTPFRAIIVAVLAAEVGDYSPENGSYGTATMSPKKTIFSDV